MTPARLILQQSWDDPAVRCFVAIEVWRPRGRHRRGPLVSSVAVSAPLRCNSASQLRPYTRRSPSTRPAGISGRSPPRSQRITRRPAGARHRAPRRSSSATSPGSSAYQAKGGSAKRRSTSWSRGSTARNGRACRMTFGGLPSFAALARSTGTACGPGSIASTRRAPRLRASNVNAPEPAQQSTTRSPSMRCPSQSNSACLTRSGSGRVSRPRGASSRRPLNVPPMIRRPLMVGRRGGGSSIAEAAASRRPARRREPPVEIVGGADEREVRERLREVPEVLAALAELLAVQPEVVRVAEDLLEVEPRLLEIAHAGETLDVPEGAHAEGPLPPGKPVGEPVAEPIAVDQGVADQVLLDGMEGGDPAGVRRRDEPNQRHEERGGVERGRALGLDERLAPRVPEVGEDVAVDLVAHVVPAYQWSRERALLRQAHGAVERRPAEHARVEELLAPAAHLPDALVLVAPVGADPVDEAAHVGPQVVGDRGTVLVVEVDRVHQLAVDVELEVGGGRVADAHGRGAQVALEVRQRLLGEPVATVDPVHDLEGAVGFELLAARLDPAHEGRRLLGEAEAHEAVEREGGVADPGVAIVPVPLAAELLGKPEGGGRDDGAVRPRGEELEGQRGAVDHLTPAALVGGATEPPAPEVDGALEGVRDVVGRGAGSVLSGPHLLEHEPGRLVRAQGELGDRGAGLDAQRHRRAEVERDRMV